MKDYIQCSFSDLLKDWHYIVVTGGILLFIFYWLAGKSWKNDKEDHRSSRQAKLDW